MGATCFKLKPGERSKNACLMFVRKWLASQVVLYLDRTTFSSPTSADEAEADGNAVSVSRLWSEISVRQIKTWRSRKSQRIFELTVIHYLWELNGCSKFSKRRRDKSTSCRCSSVTKISATHRCVMLMWLFFFSTFVFCNIQRLVGRLCVWTLNIFLIRNCIIYTKDASFIKHKTTSGPRTHNLVWKVKHPDLCTEHVYR